jgi:hypothetical protein
MTRGDRNEARKVLSGGVDTALSTKGGGSFTRKGVKRTVECVPQAHGKEVEYELTDCEQSYMEDEGRSLGVGFQEQASNHPKLLRSRAVVVSVGAKVQGVPWAGMDQRDERK